MAEKNVETVVLSDGRSVDFVGKRKLLKDTIINDDGTVAVRLDFRNGETRTWTIPQDLLLQSAGHGAAQKLGDECAGIQDPEDMVLAVDDLIGRLNEGNWNVKREGGSGFAGTSVLLRALVEFSGKSPEEIKAFLKDKTQADKMALRASPQLKPIVDRLEAEKVAKSSKVNTDELFGELGA